MKIRHPWIIKSMARMGAAALRLWLSTLRCQADACGQDVDYRDPRLRERFIYAFWHEDLISALALPSHAPMTVMISQHADGEIIAQICEAFGVRTVRGSSTRGGGRALQKMLDLAHTSHLAITPDGPRGPRRQVKGGVIPLASWTGMRIVPCGVGARRAWRFQTWDRMVLPKPWSTITCLAGEVLAVPPGIDKKGVEEYRRELERRMLATSQAAQAWADGQQAHIPWRVRQAAA